MVKHPATGTWLIVAAVILAIVYFALLGYAMWADFKEEIKDIKTGGKDSERRERF